MSKLTPAGFDWQSIAFFMLDLKRKFTPSASSHLAQPLEFHIIETLDDNWLAILCAAYPHKQFRQRMIQDCQQCYIAVLHGELAAYAWVTTSTCHVSEIDFDLPVGPGRIYIYDCFVLTEYRRLGIYNALLMKILADYRLPRWPNSYYTACIGVEPRNTASVRGIRRAGFKEFTRVRYLHMGAFSRWYGARSLIERMSAPVTRALSD